MSMGHVKKIVIAARSPLYREGLKIALASDRMAQFTEAESITKLLEQVGRGGQPGLVIIDNSLFRAGDKDRVIDYISTSVAPVLLICNQPDLSICQAVKGYGVQGLISKTSSLDCIQLAAQTLLAGRSFWPDADKLSPRKANMDTTKRLIIERIDTLTPKEKVVLSYLREGKLYKQIAYELGLCDATVKYHSANIQRKIQSRNRTHLVALLKKVPPQNDVLVTGIPLEKLVTTESFDVSSSMSVA